MTDRDDSIQLAVQDAEDYRSIRLSLTTEGGIDVRGFDTGPAVENSWKSDDFEFGIKIAAADAQRLILALIVEHYGGDLNAVGKLRSLAERNGIEPNFWAWT